MTATEVKTAREKLGLTQEQLAHKLKRTVRTVANWEESGVKKVRDWFALQRLVKNSSK